MQRGNGQHAIHLNVQKRYMHSNVIMSNIFKVYIRVVQS